MTQVQQQATLHEDTVQGVANGSVKPFRKRRSKNELNGPIMTYEIHPLLKKHLEEMDLDLSRRRVRRIDQTTILIVNR